MIVNFIAREWKKEPVVPVRSLWNLVGFDQEPPVDHSCERAAQQRADPINQLVVPMTAGQRRSKRPGRVHRGTSKGTSEKNIESDCQPNRQSADARRPGVDC